MTVEETKYDWTFKMNPPCHVYSCANCPYRQGYRCYYGNKDYDKIFNNRSKYIIVR